MTPEQKQQAKQLIADWTNVSKTSTPAVWFLNADCMAGFLQELVDAPATEPVARVTGYYAGYLSIATVDGRVLPAGTALYTAPPHQSEHHLEMVNTPAPSVQDAELVTVPRELLGAASYAIKKNLPAPKILEQLRRYALGGVAAPTPAPIVPDEELQAAFDRGLKAGNEQKEPEPEPVAYATGYYAGCLSIATVDGRVLPAGTALYTAPPAPSVPDMRLTGQWESSRIADYNRGWNECRQAMLSAAPTPAEAPADVARDSVASEPVGYLYTNLQSGKYHVSDYDDDYRGPERVLWCIEPVYRRAKGKQA